MTPNLQLPEMEAGLSQPHLRMNDALREIDYILDGVVDSYSAFEQPNFDLEVYGTRHIINGSPSGDWDGKPYWIANFREGAWHYTAPKYGMLAWKPDEQILLVYIGPSDGWFLAATLAP